MLFLAIVSAVVPPAPGTHLNGRDNDWSWIGTESEPTDEGFSYDPSSGEGPGAGSGDGHEDGSGGTAVWTYLSIAGGAVLLVLSVGWCYWLWKRNPRGSTRSLSESFLDNRS